MNQAEADASEEALGVEKEQSNQVRTGGPAQEASQASNADSGDSLSITVKMLLKRMQRLRSNCRTATTIGGGAGGKLSDARGQVTGGHVRSGARSRKPAALMEVAAALVRKCQGFNQRQPGQHHGKQGRANRTFALQ
jgi:hypothetical protein